MISEMLSIGKSAVAAQQVLLRTTSNNIANIATDNYVRQRSVTTDNALALGVGSVITQRLNDTFKQQEVWRDTANLAFNEAVYEQIHTVDQYLSNNSIGLSSSITKMFTSLESANNNPISESERTEFMSSIQGFMDRFNTLYDDIESVLADNERKLEESTKQANELIKSIANFNNSIAAIGQKHDSFFYNLIDQRDEAIAQLANLVDIRTVPNEQNSDVVGINLASGQSLVLVESDLNQCTYGHIEVVPGTYDQSSKELAIRFEGSSLYNRLGSNYEITGGKIGGLLDCRREINEALSSISQLTVSLTVNFNNQNSQGFDLYGQQGEALFEIPHSYPLDPSDDWCTACYGKGSVRYAVDPASIEKLSDCNLCFVSDDTGAIVECYQVMEDGTLSENTVNPADYGIVVDTDPAYFYAEPNTRVTIKPAVDLARHIRVKTTDAKKLALSQSGMGPSDNSNGIQMSRLQNKPAVTNGGAYSSDDDLVSFTVRYAAITCKFGAVASNANISLQAAEGKLEQSKSSYESASGVSLDEEAAHLVQYQQYYSAAAKIITASQNTFQSLLGALSI
jgi:flagellar hook-associated protein FlgK